MTSCGVVDYLVENSSSDDSKRCETPSRLVYEKSFEIEMVWGAGIGFWKSIAEMVFLCPWL